MRVVVALMAVALPAAAAPQVTFEGLLDEMTDLERLASWPDPYFAAKQASSYDRRSTDPEVKTEENWLANIDWVSAEELEQFVRIEETPAGTEYVLMEHDGPGAVVRVWMALGDNAGNLRVYLDGAEKPAIDLPAGELLAGKTALAPPPLAGVRAQGWNLNLPIPYAESCKVVTTDIETGQYWYQVTYRSYAEGTKVETFRPEFAETRQDAIQRAAEALARPLESGASDPIDQELAAEWTIEPGGTVSLPVFRNNAAVRRLECRVEAGDRAGALRGCVLEIAFDDLPAPAVKTPLGDFFGTAPGVNPYRSVPSGVMEDGRMRANWVMPFRHAALFRLTNTTDQPVTVSLKAGIGPRAWRQSSMYFHARTRIEEGIPTIPRSDWNFVRIDGRGVYAGNMLLVANPRKHWWGEGDEKIFVDDEEFPSFFGTGTEDYYGYAVCSRDLFSHAYHNQTRCDGPGNSGYACLSRFHIMDAIPFRRALDFDMEVWHWEEGEVAYAATSWWYGRPGATSNLQAGNALELLRVAPLPPPSEREGHSLFGD